MGVAPCYYIIDVTWRALALRNNGRLSLLLGGVGRATTTSEGEAAIMMATVAACRRPQSCRAAALLLLAHRCCCDSCCNQSAILSGGSISKFSSSLYPSMVRSYTGVQGRLHSLDSSKCNYYSSGSTVGGKDGQIDAQRKVSQPNPTRSQHNNRSTKHHHYSKINFKENPAPFYSVRLINESAARETTRLFIKLQREKSSDTKITKGKPPWRDTASLLAAEQALEFWAHRKDNQKQRNITQPGDNKVWSQSHQLETNAQTALDLFTALHHFHTIENDVTVLTNGMYSHVIDALAKSPKKYHVSEADRLLRQFVSLYVVEKLSTRTKENDDLHSTLHELRLPFHANDDIDGLSMPASIKWNYKDKHHFPNKIRITGVMRGHVRQLHPKEAESLLYLKIKLSPFCALFQPNEIGYATLIDGYSRVCDGENAERILLLMKGRFGGDTNGANVVAYNAAISAWARCACRVDDFAVDSIPNETAASKSRSDAKKAEQLLREMWSFGADRMNDGRACNRIVPDVVSYSSVISAYASCLDQPFGLKRAEELLTELEGLAEQENDESHTKYSRGGCGRHPDGFHLNATVYNTLLNAYAAAADTISAENLLDRMIKLHTRSSIEGGGGPFRNVMPNTRTFNVVLNTWAKKGRRDAGAKASDILRKMEDMSAGLKDRINQPDVISYNTVLAAWSKSAGYDPTSSDDENIVGKEAAYKAKQLLDQMESQSCPIKPDIISYNTTILAFANAAQTREAGLSMAKEAENLISRMKDHMGIDADDYSYNGVLLAWSRSSGGMASAQHCESILRSMSHPTYVSWSTVINAFAHAGGAQEAESLLKEMEKSANVSARRCRSNNYASNIPIVVYNNVIHAWSRSADPNASKNSEAILNRLENGTALGYRIRSSNTLDAHLPKPDVISYLLVLNALEYTKDSDKGERAKSVLNRFKASLLAENDFNSINHQMKQKIQGAYNSVLAACAYTPSHAGEQARSNAARTLAETLRDMNRSTAITLGPNQESFSVFLQGCIHLLQPDSTERALLMRSALQECCEKGYLNTKIWDKFCSSSSEEEVQLFISGINECDGSFATLPDDWKKNAA